MRDLFPGYYRPTKEEFDQMWKECTFSFDTNTLLNIYRYSESTRNNFLEILSRLKDRVWLPYQVAFEYQKNRLTVISDQVSAYQAIPSAFQTTLQENKDKFRRHSFIDFDLIQKSVDEIKSVVEQAKNNHPDLSKSDKLRERLDKIFEGKIGKAYSENDLTDIYKEADKRFQHQIPPGYKDGNKKLGIEKYGDVVIWRELKRYGTDSKKSLIFVTDDSKEDWWWKHNGETIGPRPELIQEMKNEAGIQFYMYSQDRFMEFALDFLELKKNPQAIEEVKKIREQDKVDAMQVSTRLMRSFMKNSFFTLDQVEIAILTCIKEEQMTSDEVSAYHLKTTLEKQGLNGIEISLGVDSLIQRGFVQLFSGYDDYHHTAYKAYQVTSEGVDWLLRNRSRLRSYTNVPANDEPVEVGEDDIPF